MLLFYATPYRSLLLLIHLGSNRWRADVPNAVLLLSIQRLYFHCTHQIHQQHAEMKPLEMKKIKWDDKAGKRIHNVLLYFSTFERSLFAPCFCVIQRIDTLHSSENVFSWESKFRVTSPWWYLIEVRFSKVGIKAYRILLKCLLTPVVQYVRGNWGVVDFFLCCIYWIYHLFATES